MTNTADHPFYGFEYEFSSEGRSGLSEGYTIPKYFTEDVYNFDDRTRAFYPNYKHAIIGGLRSGTNLHFDPKGDFYIVLRGLFYSS